MFDDFDTQKQIEECFADEYDEAFPELFDAFPTPEELYDYYKHDNNSFYYDD